MFCGFLCAFVILGDDSDIVCVILVLLSGQSCISALKRTSRTVSLFCRFFVVIYGLENPPSIQHPPLVHHLPHTRCGGRDTTMVPPRSGLSQLSFPQTRGCALDMLVYVTHLLDLFSAVTRPPRANTAHILYQQSHPEDIPCQQCYWYRCSAEQLTQV